MSELYTKRIISHDEAEAAINRYVGSWFRNKGVEAPRLGIPARPDYDDDLILAAYIEQRKAADLTPEALLKAYEIIVIENNHTAETPATTWWVVDASTAEPEVNWPGELISEHTSWQDARLGWAKALILRAQVINSK